MSDGTLWKVVGDTALPRILNPSVFGTARTIAGPIRTMASIARGAVRAAARRQRQRLPVQRRRRRLHQRPAGDLEPDPGLLRSHRRRSQRVLLPGQRCRAERSADAHAVGADVHHLGRAGAADRSDSGHRPRSDAGHRRRCLPTRGGPTTVSRPVSAVAAVGARTFARFSAPIRLNANAAATRRRPDRTGGRGHRPYHRHRDFARRSPGERYVHPAGQHERPHDGGGSPPAPRRMS